MILVGILIAANALMTYSGAHRANRLRLGAVWPSDTLDGEAEPQKHLRRSIVAVASTIMIPVLFNLSIHDREQKISNGETLFMELAPVDPRSLTPGDSVQLRYVVEREAPADRLQDHELRAYLVIRGSSNSAGTFVRFHDGEELESNEKPLRFHRRYNQVRIVPDAFFCQEGHAEFYDGA